MSNVHPIFQEAFQIHGLEERRSSFANMDTYPPEVCEKGGEHDWVTIRVPIGRPYQSGLTTKCCQKCSWEHSVDDSD